MADGKSAVIDFHSHILPKMDDGSKNIEMSLDMLRSARDMGVDAIVATPHFYGHRESISVFLERREHSWQCLSQAMEGEQLPTVLLGAEVAFFSGLTQLEELERLCANGTKTLLLEMPFTTWTGYELDAVSALCLDGGYQVVLAHLERYFLLQRDERLIDSLLSLPLWVQINAEALLHIRHRGQWLKLFREGQAHLMGSDCHNLTNRPPNLAAGRKVLGRKAGTGVLEEMDKLGGRLLALGTLGGQDEG